MKLREREIIALLLTAALLALVIGWHTGRDSRDEELAVVVTEQQTGESA